MKLIISALPLLSLALTNCMPPPSYGGAGQGFGGGPAYGSNQGYGGGQGYGGNQGYGGGPRGGDSFTTRPVGRNSVERPVLVKKKGRYYVTRPWTVELGGERFFIKKGYSSNGITASGKLKATLGDGPDRPETWAAVFHDWLFKQPGMTRAKADRLFYEILLAYGVPELKARLMYTSVSAYSASKLLR